MEVFLSLFVTIEKVLEALKGKGLKGWPWMVAAFIIGSAFSFAFRWNAFEGSELVVEPGLVWIVYLYQGLVCAAGSSVAHDYLSIARKK